ncbi:CASP-like protein 4B1 [Neltuma alba]|uniref:CASP-like protein 4B1 n=1 Tax=Neltuma alba TaxID=207710 RepID=UPI0010A4C0B7|nr:CASP-like protein 4B1 [Prosopis alba]
MSSVGESSEARTQLESQPAAADEALTAPGGGGFSDLLQREKRENLLKRSLLGLRVMALLSSLAGFMVMASNSHGHGFDFNKFEEYRYILAVTIICTMYTIGQVYRQVQELCNGKDLLQPKKTSLIDFVGDEMMAYLLISAASSGMPRTNGMRNYGGNHKLDMFLERSGAAIGMSIMAFICLALSALLSVYKLSTYVPDYI